MALIAALAFRIPAIRRGRKISGWSNSRNAQQSEFSLHVPQWQLTAHRIVQYNQRAHNVEPSVRTVGILYRWSSPILAWCQTCVFPECAREMLRVFITRSKCDIDYFRIGIVQQQTGVLEPCFLNY
nr:hypothetical protein [uncultured Ruegeria sp.]